MELTGTTHNYYSRVVVITIILLVILISTVQPERDVISTTLNEYPLKGWGFRVGWTLFSKCGVWTERGREVRGDPGAPVPVSRDPCQNTGF